MALTADATGVVNGKFTIPANVTAGSKTVEVAGSTGSAGEAVFLGQGSVVENVMRKVTRIANVKIDPLAQTFMMASTRQISAAELYVTAVGDSPIIVQIRETDNGYPSRTILAEGRLRPEDVVVGQWNRFIFDEPVYITANVEYSLVALCNDADGALAIAELGKWDATNAGWVTSQPYNVGVLFSSSNASAWTAHQDRDMAFRLLARKYTQTEKIVSLGSVAVVNATDLIMRGMNENPATGTDSKLQLALPDGRTIDAGNNQVIQLGDQVTGDISVSALLQGTTQASATLKPGSQLIAGQAAQTADYISRAMKADAEGANVRIIFDANLPSGANVEVYVQGADEGDAWLPVTQSGDASAIGDDWYEYQYLYEALMEAQVRVKLVLNGTAAARPYVANLRVSIT